jgi:transcriptional regulator with XRE-family HTH domain
MQNYDGDFRCELIRRQAFAGESDGRFAARLGINRETWRMIRHGKAPITARTLQRIARAYPDLTERARASFLPRSMQ